jgi:hypothetical protein
MFVGLPAIAGNDICGIRTMFHAFGNGTGGYGGIGFKMPYNSDIADTTLPWDNPPLVAYALLRCNMATMKFELVSSVGDGVAPVTVVQPTTPAFVPFTDCTLELVWDPTIPALRSYVNGALHATISDPALLPRWAENQDTGVDARVVLFCETFNDAAASIVAQFAAIQCYSFGDSVP